MLHSTPSPNTNNLQSLCIGALLVVGSLCAVYTLWSVLLPFLLAGILAYVNMPLVRFFQNTLRIRSRGISVVLVLIFLIALLSLGIIYLVPAIQTEVEKTMSIISGYTQGRSLLELLIPSELQRTIQKNIDLSQIAKELTPDNVMQVGRTLWSQIGSIIDGTLSFFSWGVVIFVFVLYFIMIMTDFEKLSNGAINIFPQSYRSGVAISFKMINYYMNSYFRGQGLVALCVGILLSIGFTIIGLPMAIVMGIFIGILNLVPYLQAAGLLPLALMGVLMSVQTGQSAFFCIALAFGVLMIVQIIQDAILTPAIMGQSLGMSPAIILLSLSIWGSLLGFFGMLIALPLTMSIYAIYMRFILKDQAYITQIDAKIEKRKSAKRK